MAHSRYSSVRGRSLVMSTSKARTSADQLATLSLSETTLDKAVAEEIYTLIKHAAAFDRGVEGTEMHDDLERRSQRFQELARSSALERPRTAAWDKVAGSLSKFQAPDGSFGISEVWR